MRRPPATRNRPETGGRTATARTRSSLSCSGVEAPSGWGRRVGPAQAARTRKARLPLVLLAQVAADREQTMDVETWRRRDPAAARYLGFLASTGYQLSEIKQRVVDEDVADHDAGTDDDGDQWEEASTDDPGFDDAAA